MREHPGWWPVHLSPRVEEAVSSLCTRLLEDPVSVDEAAARSAASLIETAMMNRVRVVVAEDRLPALGHLINGWGDGLLDGRPISDRLMRYAHRDGDGRLFIPQRHPEGEFHPWQAFAYAVMAGCDVDREIDGQGVTIRDLARESRYINTSEGEELGHLLFAWAHLEGDAEGQPFLLDGVPLVPRDLVARAIEAHVSGHFQVCRKVHLTEGLCAVATLPQFEDVADRAAVFLDGQLEMLLLLAIVLDGRVSPVPEDQALARELQEVLILGNYIDNHIYLAGHIVELAMLAHRLAMPIRPEYRSVIASVTNRLNDLLSDYIHKMSFDASFLALGHYRRAITLLCDGFGDVSGQRGSSLLRSDLASYTVDFDRRPSRAAAGVVAPPPASTAEIAPFGVCRPDKPSDPSDTFMEDVSAAFGRLAGQGFELKGQEAHFRRVLPAGWPRAAHYEVLRTEDGVGAEFHMEASDLRDAAARHVAALLEPLRSSLPLHAVEWNDSWYRHGCRMRVLFPSTVSPGTVASALHALIGQTFPVLDPMFRMLSSDPAWRRPAGGAEP